MYSIWCFPRDAFCIVKSAWENEMLQHRWWDLYHTRFLWKFSFLFSLKGVGSPNFPLREKISPAGLKWHLTKSQFQLHFHRMSIQSVMQQLRNYFLMMVFEFGAICFSLVLMEESSSGSQQQQQVLWPWTRKWAGEVKTDMTSVLFNSESC